MRIVAVFKAHSVSFLKKCCCLFVAATSLVVSLRIPAVGIPSTIQPGQLEKQLVLPPSPSPKSQPIEIFPALEQQKTQIEDSTNRFKLYDIDFDGAAAYSQQFLKSFFSEIIGKTVTIKQIRTASDNLTTHYRNDGYVLARALIPAQTLKNGIVKIKVIEGFIESVNLQADQGVDTTGLIQDYIDKIRATKPLRQSVLERYLLLLNDLPGIYASGSLTPSSSQPGAAVLVIQVKHKKFGVQAGFNNRLPELLGTYRGEFYAEENNLLGWQEKSYARLLQSFEGKMTILSLGQDIGINDEGTKLSFMVNQVWSQSSIFNTSIGLKSDLISFNIGFSHPLLRSRNSNLLLRGGFSGVDSQSDAPQFNTTLIDDRIRSFRVGLTYDLADQFYGVNLVDIELSQGIDALGARNPSASSRANGTANLSAANGQLDYTKVTLYLSRLQSLTEDFSLLAAFNGQYSEDVLLSPEQFAMGGEQFLRAYDPSEFIGDKGWAAKAELRYALNAFSPVNTTLYGFYDYGQIFYNDHRSPSISAAAAGAGMRVSFTQYFTGYIEGAKPLHPDESSQGNRDMRVFGGFRLSYYTNPNRLSY
ncbi:ShlB/FhaC/HecB family hemolysin secretion/activation protein [Methyloglobulus sp.]|uniref:ShlB/FhaC/HecB family hemolysin secretion/activation protein n=1 Tax=Methyloglobulus sp. TaxID=2518622 RepID=UPI003989EAB1